MTQTALANQTGGAVASFCIFLLTTNALLRKRLCALQPATTEEGGKRPFFLHLDEPAQEALQAFRQECRKWESEAAGLMKSHIGKLPGLAVRVATMLALLDAAIFCLL